MSERGNYISGIFQLSHTVTKYHQLVILLLVVFQLAPMSNTFETGSRYYYENESDTSKEISQEHTTTEFKEIPLDFYKKLNNVNNESEFLALFGESEENDHQSENSKRDVERSNAEYAKPVKCEPVDTVVRLNPINADQDPSNVFYYPSCTLVKRCRNCGDSSSISCQPVETELVNFRVRQRYYGGSRQGSMVIIPVEKHINCSMQCVVKAEDCKSSQIYDPNLCQCKCKPKGSVNIKTEIAECTKDDKKIWDNQNCDCVCRKTLSCTTGTTFDYKDCKCTAQPKLTKEERKRLQVKPILLNPDNRNIYSL